MVKILKITLIFFLAFFSLKGQTPQNTFQHLSADKLDKQDYFAGKVIVKINSPAQENDNSADQRKLSEPTQNGDTLLKKHVPEAESIARFYETKKQDGNARTKNTPQTLENIYVINFPKEKPVEEVIQRLMESGQVEYAEPYYKMELLRDAESQTFIPNDPKISTLDGEISYFDAVNAYEAWEKQKGDSSIILGILDTGVKLGHEDLVGTIHYNKADPINGVDDDGDGYTDNYLGWDIADDDNYPAADKDQHGTMVTGLSSATPNNEKGIAGIGFKTSYMPVKVFKSADNQFRNGYEGIIYAAEQGCQVINLSWGAANVHSQFLQDIINYVVEEKDVVVVAAAGNTGQEDYYYPASYQNVLSVAFSNTDDTKADKASYNYDVDLMAPGVQNLTTDNGGDYSRGSGSSFAAPLVAGASALVRAQFPDYNANQVMEKIRLSTDDIYNTGNNSNYQEQLGYGRLNMEKALDTTETPAVRMVNLDYTNGVGSYAYHGDTLAITTRMVNFLKATSANGEVTLTSTSPYVTILENKMPIGGLETMDTLTNAANPFKVKLHGDLPASEKMVFRLGYQDGDYEDYQYFTIQSAPDYINVNNNALELTVGSNGNLGYNGKRYTKGVGFKWDQQQLAKNMGMIFSASEEQVSDNVINNFASLSRDQDLSSENEIRLFYNSNTTIDARSVINDNASQDPIGLKMQQSILAEMDSGKRQFVILQYRLINRGDSAIKNLNAGIFTDWDLGDKNNNKAQWDSLNNMGYAYATGDKGLYAGLGQLTGMASSYYAIDKKNHNGNQADLDSLFTDKTKHDMLAQGIAKEAAGVEGSGNDIAGLQGIQLENIPRDSAVQIAFALVAGESKEALDQALEQARETYRQYQENPPLMTTIPVCMDSAITINPTDGDQYKFFKDPEGNHLLHEGNSWETGAIASDTTFYVANTDSAWQGPVKRIDLKIKEPEANFIMASDFPRALNNDTLFLDERDPVKVQFISHSTNAASVHWHFDNGYESSLDSAESRFTKPGTYNIRLSTTSIAGCVDTLTKTLHVVQRGPKPQMEDFVACKGESITLEALNAGKLTFYADSGLNQTIHHGASWTTPPLNKDTVFYVVNNDSTYDSYPAKVVVDIAQPDLDFTYALDTSLSSNKYTLRLEARDNLPGNATYQWVVNGKEAGKDTTLLYDYSQWIDQDADSLAITLEITNEMGCTYLVTHIVDLQTSPAPRFADTELVICHGEKSYLQPDSGETFFYYNDPDLQQPVFKGKLFETAKLYNDTTFYVTRMDGLKESKPEKVTIQMNRIADFRIMVKRDGSWIKSDTLIMDNKNEVKLKSYRVDSATFSIKEQNTSWQWKVNEETVGKLPDMVHEFNNPGQYDVQLIAQSSEGCKQIVSRKLHVQKVTAIGEENNDKEKIGKTINLYPNPTGGRINLEMAKNEPVTFYLKAINGKTLGSGQIPGGTSTPHDIDLNQVAGQALTSGTYILQLNTGKGMIAKRIMVKHP